MKKFSPRLIFFITFLFLNVGLLYLGASENLSLQQEIKHSLDKALSRHEQQSRPEGYWGNPEYPALTALALRATHGHPDKVEATKFKKQTDSAYSFCVVKSNPMVEFTERFSIIQHINLSHCISFGCKSKGHGYY